VAASGRRGNHLVGRTVSVMSDGKAGSGMGFIKQAKQDAIAKEAERAVEEGRRVFTPKLNTPMTQHGLSGSIAGWAEMIEAIEDAGWTMVDWAVAHDAKGRLEAYPLFRRR
jgi:hypothetical protein